MTGPLIRFEDVALAYGGSTILGGISLSFNEGDAVGLVGPNGSGKTTFLRAVLGLLKPRRGIIDRDLSRRFAYVPQVEDLNFFWPLTVRQAVALAAQSARPFGRISPRQNELIDSAMEKTGVAPIGHLLLRDVSGGQRQRTILAQALSQAPDILLLDEPTRGLDVVAERDLLDLIAGLRSQNLTILLVSHSLQIPLNMTDKIILFDKGAVISTTPEEILHTNKLEEIYGVPFLHHEYNGFKWVMPLGGKS